MIKRKAKWFSLMEDNRKAIEIYGNPKISRKQAKDSKLKFYWPGKPCAKGHLTYRYTSSCACRQCALEDLSEYNGYSDNTDKNIKKKRDLLFEIELKNIQDNFDCYD